MKYDFEIPKRGVLQKDADGPDENKTHHAWFLIAEGFAQFSPDPYRKVGAVLIYENRLISYGWNAPNGSIEIKDYTDRELVNERITHAEANCVVSASHIIPLNRRAEACLYVTKKPCDLCEKRIKTLGFSFKYVDLPEGA